jgi:hypothetical protein
MLNRGFKQRAHRATLTASAKEARSARIDRVLARLANASQLGVLLLAGFGYFYTVLPVYQKSLLDEEIAKKTIELNAKDGALQAKNAELQALLGTVVEARNSALRAQVEVGKLKGAIRNQYDELRARLIQEFVLLTRESCKLEKMPSGSFSKCVEEKVFAPGNLTALTAADRRLLLQIVSKRNREITAAWQKIELTFATAQQQAEGKAKDGEARCAQAKESAAYKDANERISIDYRCSMAELDTRYAMSDVRVKVMNDGSKFLAEQLTTIIQAFYAAAPM